MAEQEDGLGGFDWPARGPRSEARFEHIAVALLPVQFDAAAELLQVRGSEGNAGVDGGFRSVGDSA